MSSGGLDPNSPDLAEMKNNPSFSALLKNKGMINSMLQMVKDPNNSQIRDMVKKNLPGNISVDTAIRAIEVILMVAGPVMVVKDVLTHKVSKLIMFGLFVWFIASYFM